MKPTISVVIPTYNRARFIPEALTSVFGQTDPVDEILVIDDGSTDGTAEIMKAYGDSVRYIRQKNAGPGAARNNGLREARSDFIALLDSDDLWVPEKIALQRAFLVKHPETDYLFGDMAIVAPGEDNNVAEIKIPELHHYYVSHATHLEDFFDCLVVENMVPTSSVLFRRSCIERVGFFDEKLRIAEDLDYWLRIAFQFHCSFVEAVLVKRRRHDDNLINNWARTNECHADVLQRTLSMYPTLTPKVQAVIRKKLTALYYDLGSYYLKRRDFTKSHSFLSRGGPRHSFDWRQSMKLRVSSLLS